MPYATLVKIVDHSREGSTKDGPLLPNPCAKYIKIPSSCMRKLKYELCDVDVYLKSKWQLDKDSSGLNKSL